MLTTVQQRIKVVKTFALSRTYYVASILSIRSGYIKNFESIIKKFIWQGSFSVLKVAFDELKKQETQGRFTTSMSFYNGSLPAYQSISQAPQIWGQKICLSFGLLA